MAGVPPLGPPQHIDEISGKFILAHYDIPGDLTWHARLVLSHTAGGEWVILTPGGDLYAEDFGANSHESDSWRLLDPHGPFPHPKVNTSLSHHFPKSTLP